MKDLDKKELHLLFEEFKNSSDEKSYSLLYEKYKKLVYNIAFCIIKNRENTLAYRNLCLPLRRLITT